MVATTVRFYTIRIRTNLFVKPVMKFKRKFKNGNHVSICGVFFWRKWRSHFAFCLLEVISGVKYIRCFILPVRPNRIEGLICLSHLSDWIIDEVRKELDDDGTVEICASHGKFKLFPGLFLFSGPGRFIRPVSYLGSLHFVLLSANQKIETLIREAKIARRR